MASSANTSDPANERSRPNVIWILCDQLRAQALGHAGDPHVCTPNIDNLARDGMRFTQAVAGAPWCCPFRGALLTGQYPHQNGVTATPGKLDPSLPTITQPLKEAGYHTAYVGKWHLGGSNGMIRIPPGERGGFDYWLGYENRNAQWDTEVHGTGAEEGFRLEGYETDALASLFIEHLEQIASKQQPFFGVLSVQPPHDPYLAPEAFHRGRNPASIRFRPNVPDVPWVRQRFASDLCGYYAMIENLDHNVGRLRSALRRLDIDRETILVFFSDHGDCLGAHAQQQKSSPWEESIRIPFIVGRAGGRHRGKVGTTDALLNHVDIAPTTLGLCGLPIPSWMRGYDYSAHCLKGQTPQRDEEPDSAFLQQIPAKSMAHSVNRPWRGVVTRDGWKYAALPGQDWLLFHNAEDPYEMANYVFDNVYEDRRRTLRDRLQRWIDETGDQFPLPGDP